MYIYTTFKKRDIGNVNYKIVFHFFKIQKNLKFEFKICINILKTILNFFKIQKVFKKLHLLVKTIFLKILKYSKKKFLDISIMKNISCFNKKYIFVT